METGYLNLDGGKLYYEVAGQGKTLVLVHSGFVDSGMWDAQWSCFTEHYRVVRYDMRGFGKSDPLQVPVNRRDELYRLLRHLEIEQAVLLGCSLGGEIIIDLALEYPEMVTGLIPVSAVPGGFEMQGEPPAALIEMMGAMEQGDLDRVSELQMRLWMDGGFRQPHEIDAAVRQHAAAMNAIVLKNGTQAFDMQPVNLLDPPAATRLNQLRVPTLVMTGALDHPELLRAANVMEAQIEGAQKLIIPGTAHMPNMEKPDAFNQAVRKFLG